jgi:hypothetical protein
MKQQLLIWLAFIASSSAAAEPSLDCRASGSLAVTLNRTQQSVPLYDRPECRRLNAVFDTNAMLNLGDSAKRGETFAAVIATVRAKLPGAPVGTYIDSSGVDDPVNGSFSIHDPPRALPVAMFDSSDFVAGQRPYILDLSQPSVRHRAVNGIVAEAARRLEQYGVHWIFTDDWGATDPADPSPWPIAIADTLAYMDELTAALHARGIRHVPNFRHFVRNPMDSRDLERVAQADAIAVEWPFDSRALKTPADAARMLKDIAFLSSHNCPPCLLVSSQQQPDSVPEKEVAERQFLCGCAMLAGNAFVSWGEWEPLPDCILWPAKLGAPLEPMQQNGMKISQRFEHGTLTVDFAARSASTK